KSWLPPRLDVGQYSITTSWIGQAFPALAHLRGERRALDLGSFRLRGTDLPRHDRSSRRLSPGSSHPRTAKQAENWIPGMKPGMTNARDAEEQVGPACCRHSAASFSSVSPGLMIVNSTGASEISSLAPRWRAMVNCEVARSPSPGKSARKWAPRLFSRLSAAPAITFETLMSERRLSQSCQVRLKARSPSA